MTSSIYLTIDDAPSRHLPAKVSFLTAHNIPAVLFCRGDCIRPHKDNLIEAIQRGFLIGNHSYSHPRFSKIPINECFEEILRTENLINMCFEEARAPRPAKLIRLPFGDRGAGDHVHIPHTPMEVERVHAIQNFLRQEGFRPLIFSSVTDPMIDAYWTWDTEDYKTKYIEDANAYEQALKVNWLLSKRPTEVLLLHDFNHNHHLFEVTMQFLLSKEVTFLTPEIG